MPTENRSSNTELSKIVTEALVGMVSGVTGMRPPADEPLPGFIQAPIDRAVTRISGLLAQPASQHQGEPVAWQDPENGSRMCTAEHKAYALSKGGAAALALATLTRPLYPHADPGEVERLSRQVDALTEWYANGLNKINVLLAQLDELKEAFNESQEEVVKRGKKLAEQDALLRRCLMAVREQHCDEGEAEFDLPVPLLADIDATLSASAEPEAPKCKCNMRTRLVGDGCAVCNPGRAADLSETDERDCSAESSAQAATNPNADCVICRTLGDECMACEEQRKPSAPAEADDLSAFNAAFQKAMETGWDDPIDLARQLWNARGALERKPTLDSKMIGIVHTPPAEYDEP